MILTLMFLCLLGAFTGTLSGLLGIGGGLIIVPGLVFFFEMNSISTEIIMQMAIGTSLAIMIPTTLRSLMLHLCYRVNVWEVYKQFCLGVVGGTIIGSLLASHLHSRVLILLFAIFMLIASYNMFFEKISQGVPKPLPNFWVMNGVGIATGVGSGLLGVGGGFLIMPLLSFYNISIRDALAICIAIGLTVAFIGTISFIYHGWSAPHLPMWSTGYVYWPAWLPITIGSILFAPLGTQWSHRLPIKSLKRIFSILWLIVGVHMFWLAR